MSHERRGLFLVEELEAEPGQYGCPMLIRATHLNPVNRSSPFWRCSLGWAIRTGEDVACCQATEAVCDCWKVHPERTPRLALSGMRIDQKAVAD